MKIVEPEVFVDGPIDGDKILRDIEWVARHCYKSEDMACPGSAKKLVEKFLQNDPPHLAMLDHVTIRAKFIIDRGISHELVRHRVGVGFAQESTRYCNYQKGKFGSEITVIRPPDLTTDEDENDWRLACMEAELRYLRLIQRGKKPQIARSVLPTCLKTEVVVTGTVTAWRHIFKMRCDKAAHPQMQQVMTPLCLFLQEKVPVVFDKLKPSPLPEGVLPAKVHEILSR